MQLYFNLLKNIRLLLKQEIISIKNGKIDKKMVLHLNS
jgi:hypothetical protein